jgi:hypothetical protein
MTLLQKHVQSLLLNVEAALLSMESADADDDVSQAACRHCCW